MHDGGDGQQGVVGHRHVDRLVQGRPGRRRAVEGHEHAMHGVAPASAGVRNNVC